MRLEKRTRELLAQIFDALYEKHLTRAGQKTDDLLDLIEEWGKPPRKALSKALDELHRLAGSSLSDLEVKAQTFLGLLKSIRDFGSQGATVREHEQGVTRKLEQAALEIEGIAKELRDGVEPPESWRAIADKLSLEIRRGQCARANPARSRKKDALRAVRNAIKDVFRGSAKQETIVRSTSVAAGDDPRRALAIVRMDDGLPGEYNEPLIEAWGEVNEILGEKGYILEDIGMSRQAVFPFERPRGRGRVRRNPSMTYGQLPSWSDFESAFDRETSGGTFEISLSRTDERAADGTDIAGGGEFDAEELYQGLEQLVEKWEDGDERAGDLASGILASLDIEWV